MNKRTLLIAAVMAGILSGAKSWAGESRLSLTINPSATSGSNSSTFAHEPANSLAPHFLPPASSARPWVWWWWPGCAVTKPDITANLEAMARSGIGGPEYAAAAVSEIHSALDSEKNAQSGFREVFSPGMGRILVLGITLAVFQQWCGINVVFNYAEEIFRAAGYDISDVLANIAWTGSVNLVFTFVALATVDRMGRRPLMLFGAVGLAVIYGALGLCFAAGIKGLPVLLLVLAAIGCYSMSLAPVVWVVISEIFPNRIRGAAMSVAVMALWVACFVLTYTFPYLNKALGAAGTFWVYGGICIAGFIFVLTSLPETKGKSLEQIESDLMGTK